MFGEFMFLLQGSVCCNVHQRLMGVLKLAQLIIADIQIAKE